MKQEIYKIAFASGKGGTGKTTISVNLSSILSQFLKVTYVDLDVEEPNGHLFLKPIIEEVKDFKVEVPFINDIKCTLCRKCVSFCQFSALAMTQKKVMFFEELCHSCGGCFLVCDHKAIDKKNKKIGELRKGKVSETFSFLEGVLDTSSILSPALIKYIKKQKYKSDLVIFDSPPGTSCSAMAAVEGVDHVVLVIEPTPFGINDFHLMEEALNNASIPFSVVINKGDENDKILNYCQKNNIKVWGILSHSFELAKKIAEAELIDDCFPQTREELGFIADNILRLMQR